MKFLAWIYLVVGIILITVLAIALFISGNLLIGGIVVVVGALIFNLVFYSLFPKEFLTLGGSIISVTELLVTPAVKVYEIDRETSGTKSFMFSAILLCFVPIYNIITLPADAVAKKWAYAYAFTLVALFACTALMLGENKENDALAVLMLLLATIAFIDTIVYGLQLLATSLEWGPGGFIAAGLFFIIFSTLAAWLLLSALGYMVYSIR